MSRRQLYARIENVLLAAALLAALPGVSRWAELRNYFEGDWASTTLLPCASRKVTIHSTAYGRVAMCQPS